MLGLNLEIVAKGRLQTYVVEWSHLITIGDFAGIEDGPLGELGDAVAALLVLLILLHPHLTVPFEREKVALTRLKADR